MSEAIRTFAVSLSAVVAAITLVVAVAGYFVRRRQEFIEKWQKVTIHQILHKAEGGKLSFDDLLSRFRSESLARDKYKFQPSEMSPSNLRALILDLVRDQVLCQSSPDVYEVLDRNASLLRMDDAQSNMMGMFQSMADGRGDGPDFSGLFNQMLGPDMKKMMDIFSQDSEIRNYAFLVVDEDPKKYNLGDLTTRVHRETLVDFDIVKGRIIQLVAMGHLVADEAGKLSVGSQGSRPGLGYDQ